MLESMNSKITDNIKSIVIRQYLQGKARDDIARDCVLGAGTVSNIVSEWKVNLEQYIVNDLRELALNLRRSSMSPVQCSRGFMMVYLLERFGVNEDNFENFISSFYLHCER